MYKVITISIFLLLPAYGQGLSVSPIIKSAVLPGWGEKALDNKKRSRIFMSLELTLWTLCIGSYTYSNLEESMYKTFRLKRGASIYMMNKSKKIPKRAKFSYFSLK